MSCSHSLPQSDWASDPCPSYSTAAVVEVASDRIAAVLVACHKRRAAAVWDRMAEETETTVAASLAARIAKAVYSFVRLAWSVACLAVVYS